MEIHKPKPWHGWREFLKEYLIVVVGVLTALVAEQVVEELHWAKRLSETRAQLSSELSGDVSNDLAWLADAPCLDRQLEALNEAVWRARETGVFTPPADPYRPPLFQSKSDAWLNARSLQVSDHFSSDETHAFSGVYFFGTELRDDVVQLHQDAAALEPLQRPLNHVSAEEADAFLSRIGQAQELQTRMHEATMLMVTAADRMGVPLRMDKVQQHAAAARRVDGPCVLDPAYVLTVLRRSGDLDTTFQTLKLTKPALRG